MPMPFFPFYARDWLSSSSVAVMTRAERGAYIDLLARMWEHSEGRDECSLPADDAYLARLMQASPKEWRAIRAALIDGPGSVFHVQGDRLTNPRMTKEWGKAITNAATRSAVGKKAAGARWHAGGNPDAPNNDAKGTRKASTEHAPGMHDASAPHAKGMPDAMPTQCIGDAPIDADADADAQEETPPPPSQGSVPVAAGASPVEAGLPLPGGEAKSGRAKRKPIPQDPEIKALTDACYEAVVEATRNKPADGGWWGTVYGRAKKLAPDARAGVAAAMAWCASQDRPTYMAAWVAKADLPQIVTAYRNRERSGLRLVPPGRASPDDEGVWGRRIDTPETVAAMQAEAARKGEQAW